MKKLHLLFYVLSFYAAVNAQSGLPDPAFGNNGFISTAPSENGKSGAQLAKACLVDPNGSILLVIQAGNKTLISKRLSSGLPNLTYGRNCFSAAVSMNVTSAALQADGKIVVGGTPNGGDDFMLARYRVNGDLDSSFGNFGVVISDRGSNQEFVNSVAIVANGKILVAGTISTNTSKQFTLVRFSADGKLDQSFGNNGSITTDIGQNSAMNKMLVQPDNKILAVGNIGGDFALARYTADGTPDAEFGVTGRITHGFGFNDVANAVAIDAAGKIYVGGITYDIPGTRHFRIARFNNNGTLDVAYNGGLGSIMPEFGNAYDDLTNVCLQTDGSIIASGYTNSSNGDQIIQVTRIKSDGTIDRNFGNNGLVLAGSDTTYDLSHYSIALPDGKILTGGSSRPNNSFFGHRFTCLRFLANGTPDQNFVGGGALVDFFPAPLFVYNKLFIQGDGRLVAASQTNFDNGSSVNLSRFNVNGSPDNTYGQNGIKSLPTELTGSVSFQPDGKVVHAGSLPSQPGDIVLLRYNVDGTPDATFGTGGKAITNLGGSESAGTLAFQTDGKIILGGFSSEGLGSDWLIIRFHPNGSIDSSFGTNGYVRKNFLTRDNIQFISIETDGKIVVGGAGFASPPEFNYNRTDMLIARLNTDGTFDAGFGDQGTRVINRSEKNSLGSLKVQNDGKVVFGYVLLIGTTNQSFLERLNANGTADLSFGVNGKLATNGPTITLQADQKILVTGSNRNNQNNAEFSLTRFTKDGTVDVSFGNNGKTLASFAPLDNSLYVNQMVGGFFYAVGSGVDKWGQNIGLISKFIVNPIQLCPPSASTSIVSDKSGTNYQWQVTTDSSFVNLSNDVHYSGVNTKTLQIINAPSSWNGNLYRCLVDGTNSSYREITFSDTWTGSSTNAWENPVNWSCGAIPDANTDVIIENGIVEVNANTTIRSLQLNGGAKITVKAGVAFTILH